MLVLNRLSPWICAALLLAVDPATVNAAGCEKPIVIHVDIDAPSVFEAAPGQLTGMDIDLVQHIFNAAHCTVQWDSVSTTYSRVLRGLETGKLDAAVRASKTAEQEKFAYFSAPYRDEVMAVYARKKAGIHRFDDLQAAYAMGLILIGPANGFYGDEFERLKTRWLAANRYTQYKQSHKAHQLLFASPTRGDIIFVDSDIFYHNLGKSLSQEVESPTDWIRVSPIHIILSKASVSSATVERLDNAIFALSKDGTLARIVAQYRPAYVQQQVAKHRQKTEP